MPVTENTTGLCATCRHARRVTSGRGSTFVFCGRSANDSRFPKYPPLPVVRCTGYESVTDDAPRPRSQGVDASENDSR